MKGDVDLLTSDGDDGAERVFDRLLWRRASRKVGVVVGKGGTQHQEGVWPFGADGPEGVCGGGVVVDDLRRDEGFTLVMVSHDIGVVQNLCTDVIVMKDGQVVEQGNADQIFDDPQAPYTQALLAAAFNLEAIEGAVET